MRLDEAALRLDGRPVSVARVLAASLIGGQGAGLVRRIADGLAAREIAAKRGLKTSAEDLQRALDSWRTERDLITADEFKRWMKAQELDLKRISAWLDRELLRERIGSGGALESQQPSLTTVIHELHESALLGGEIPGLAEELALRLVAPRLEDEDAESVEAARFDLLGRFGCESVGHAATLFEPLRLATEDIEELLDLELAYRKLRSELGGDQQLQQELKEHQDELVRFEVADASFATDDVAREVLCCVREDGDTFRRSSSRAGEPCETATVLGLELGERRFGNRLIAAKAKEVFGPVQSGGRHHLAQLVRKIEPDLRSDRVREELTDRIVGRSLKGALMERVVFAVGDAA